MLQSPQSDFAAVSCQPWLAAIYRPAGRNTRGAFSWKDASMARNWFPMRYDLVDDPAVHKMAKLLKPKPRSPGEHAAKLQRIVGCLAAIWQQFDSETAAGLLQNYSKTDVDLRVNWRGFGSAMIAAGWLEESPEGLTMPGFEKWLGRGAKRRLQDSETKKAGRMSASDADKKRTTETETETEQYSSSASAEEQTPLSPPRGAGRDSSRNGEEQAGMTHEQFEESLQRNFGRGLKRQRRTA